MSKPPDTAGDRDEERLAWPTRRGDEDLVVSLLPPHRVEGGFSPVGVLPDVGDDDERTSGQIARLASGLTRAAAGGGAVAIQGFAAPRPDTYPMTFVVAISLADVPYPESDELSERGVSRFELGCGAGVRVQRLTTAPHEKGQDALAMFTATYLAQTEYGVLALAFATPHVDAAPEFAVLFDSIARTGTVQSAAACSRPS